MKGVYDMSKKKKKKELDYMKSSSKKDKKKFKSIDKQINKNYKNLIGEISLIKEDLYNTDKAARKRAMKKAGGDISLYNKYYKGDKSRIKKRKEIAKEINSFDMDNISEVSENVSMCVATGAKLLMALIVTVLSMDSFKYNASEDSVEKLKKIYKVAKHISKY
jgi:hypothetical protein